MIASNDAERRSDVQLNRGSEDLMRKLLMTAAAALTLAGGSAATVTPASAQSWHMHGGDRGFRGGDFHRGDRDGGEDLGFGLLGFALGATLASPHYTYGPGYYDNGPGYYGPGYGYGPGGYYGTCYARERVWDPYYGRYVIERVRYAC
jgi:hypothetical protein